MNNGWNWISFFDRNPAYNGSHDYEMPTFHTEQCEQLSSLPFEQGLQVIVASTARIENTCWQDFASYIRSQNCPPELIEVARHIKAFLPEVREMLHVSDLQRAILTSQKILEQSDDVAKFALAACWYYYAKQDDRAKLVFEYLLQHHNHWSEQIQKTLRFFNQLRPRQQDVAILAAQGFTNEEIASALYIGKASVAEHLTAIFQIFAAELSMETTPHGMRYRAIHHLTKLFEKHPELLIGRANR